jgi:hypothetical protein
MILFARFVCGKRCRTGGRLRNNGLLPVLVRKVLAPLLHVLAPLLRFRVNASRLHRGSGMDPSRSRCGIGANLRHVAFVF